MNTAWKNRLSLVLLGTVVLAGVTTGFRFQPAKAAPDEASMTGPRYTVVDTEGSNLIVTDNRSNTLYFYAIDKDKEVGSELNLRGTIDLNQVGKSTIPVTKPAGNKR